MKEFFSHNKFEALQEKKADIFRQIDLDPISNTDIQEILEQEQRSKLVEKVEKKALSDYKDDPPLSFYKKKNTKIQASVRARKCGKRDDNQYTY